MANITLFAQTIAQLPRQEIRQIIREAGTDKHSKGYDTWSQLISMVFCQFSNCDSVRDISNGLKSATGNLNHLGISRAPSTSTVAYQNAHRDCSVFRDIFYRLYQLSDSRQGGLMANSVLRCRCGFWIRHSYRSRCRSTTGRIIPRQKAR